MAINPTILETLVVCTGNAKRTSFVWCLQAGPQQRTATEVFNSLPCNLQARRMCVICKQELFLDQ